MIEVKAFNKLKLKTILPGKEIYRVFDYQYIGKTWFGETCVFNHTLRLFSSPFKTKSIAISIDGLEANELKHVSDIFGIDLGSISNLKNVIELFGEPHSVYKKVDDRETYNVYSANKDFELGFTILNVGQLIYFTMDTIDVSYSMSQQ